MRGSGRKHCEGGRESALQRSRYGRTRPSPLAVAARSMSLTGGQRPPILAPTRVLTPAVRS